MKFWIIVALLAGMFALGACEARWHFIVHWLRELWAKWFKK